MGTLARVTPGPSGWRHTPHDADIGLEAWGPDLAAAFEQAALALTAVLTDPGIVAPRERIALELTATDADGLLFDWLNALVYEMATRRMLFGRFRVRIDDHRLRAEAWGEPIDVGKHAPAAEVKGATYTGLEVARGDEGGWVLRCVVDV